MNSPFEEGMPPKILLAHADATLRQQYCEWLELAGHRVALADTLEDFWQLLGRFDPELVLAGNLGVDGTLADFCQQIRRQSGNECLHVLACLEPQLGRLAIELDADDFLIEPCAQVDLIARVKQGLRLVRRLQGQAQLAETDPLTGLYNRRAMVDFCEREIQRAERHNLPLSCLLVDLDLFKQINDSYGHVAGDQALREVAGILLQMSRRSDRVCRYGGDEFAVILPETDEVGAVLLAERIRRAISEHLLTIDGRVIDVRATLGLVQWSSDIDAPCKLFDLADQAMLAAKHSGRDRVMRYSELCDGGILDGHTYQTHSPAFANIVAGQVMTTPVACLRENETLQGAADLLLRIRINSAPVVDENSRLVGIISEKDLINATINIDQWNTPIREIMRTGVVCYDQDAPVIKIWEFLRRVTIRRVVIVDKDVPVGVLSRGGLLRWLGNWGELSSSNEHDIYTSNLTQRASSTATQVTQDMTQLREDLRRADSDSVADLINAATRLQEYSQDLLALSQVHYRFTPANVSSAS